MTCPVSRIETGSTSIQDSILTLPSSISSPSKSYSRHPGLVVSKSSPEKNVSLPFLSFHSTWRSANSGLSSSRAATFALASTSLIACPIAMALFSSNSRCDPRLMKTVGPRASHAASFGSHVVMSGAGLMMGPHATRWSAAGRGNSMAGSIGQRVFIPGGISVKVSPRNVMGSFP